MTGVTSGTGLSICPLLCGSFVQHTPAVQDYKVVEDWTEMMLLL
jgi:hypothetical protein